MKSFRISEYTVSISNTIGPGEGGRSGYLYEAPKRIEGITSPEEARSSRSDAPGAILRRISDLLKQDGTTTEYTIMESLMKQMNMQGSDDNTSLKERAQEFLQRAYRLQMSGHLNEAIENYKKSIEILPTAEAHTFLGWAYSFLGDYSQAISECRKAIDLDPDFGNPYNDIGAYLIQQGELDDAIPYLELAMKAKRYATPHFPHYNYGRILERRGLWFEALGEYKASLELEPNYTLAKDAYYRLQALLN